MRSRLPSLVQVVGRPGVWSAFSFLGQGSRRSADESQVISIAPFLTCCLLQEQDPTGDGLDPTGNGLYPTGDDLVAQASYDLEYPQYEEEDAELRRYPPPKRRRPYRRRRKPKPPPSQDFYDGDYVDPDRGYNPPSSGYDPPPTDSYDSPSSNEASSYGYGYGAPSYSGYGNSLDNHLSPKPPVPTLVHEESVPAPVHDKSVTNRTEPDGDVSRAGYWQYRGLGQEALGTRRQDYDYYDNLDYDRDGEEEEEEEEGDSMFSRALQYFSGGLIGGGEECLEEYCDYYDQQPT